MKDGNNSFWVEETGNSNLNNPNNSVSNSQSNPPHSTNSQAHQSKLEQKRQEKQKKEQEGSPNEKREVVMNGAELKCQYAQAPGELVVTSNEIKLQDQLWATEGDGNNMVNLQFKGTCGHPTFAGQTPPPCLSVIKITPWQNLGTSFIQEQKVLVKESYCVCTPTPNAATPSPIPVVQSIKSNQEEIKPKILNAYFAKLTKTKDSVTSVKITERGLSYQAALVIETEGLSGKKIKVKFKSGKKKVLTGVDTKIAFIDLNDVNKVKNAADYKNIKAKEEFEVLVDNYVSKSSEFKDKAVLELILNQKADDLSFDLAELILAEEDKCAYVYVEVECSEPNVEYLGKGASKTLFLNEDATYFKIKYLEQPWVVTARKERKSGVSETTHSKRIVDEYHQINREYKPSGYLGIDGAWCASFVGWCLRENNFSAQLDPGAYSYGIINTRYREKRNIKGIVTKKEEFKDPVWGKFTEGKKLALGAISVISSGKHVTLAVGTSADKKTIFGLGGNQGNSVKVSPYTAIRSYVYPTEYTILESDYELPIYYRDTVAESVT